jgi:hypothetical protein
VPNANNNIIYLPATGALVCRVIGDASYISLQSGEALTQLDIAEDLDTVIIASDGSTYYIKQYFNEGELIDDTYILVGVPTGAQVFFEGTTYTVNDGNFSVVIDFIGTYQISLSHPSYVPATFSFTYNGSGGGGGTQPQ